MRQPRLKVVKSQSVALPDLDYEVEIVWHEDISSLDYVRELIVSPGKRAPKAPYGNARRVGYSSLAPFISKSGFPLKKNPSQVAQAETESARRRIFFLMDHDRNGLKPDGSYNRDARPMLLTREH